MKHGIAEASGGSPGALLWPVLSFGFAMWNRFETAGS
jgi:hypothetical protein